MQGNTGIASNSNVLPQGQVPRAPQGQPVAQADSCSWGECATAASTLALRTLGGVGVGAASGAIMGLMVKGGDMMVDRMFGDSGVDFPIREGVIGGAAIMSVIMGGTAFLNTCFAEPPEPSFEERMADIEMQLRSEIAREMASQRG